MRSRTKYTITSREVHDRTASTIQQHLGLADHGHKCTALAVISILLYAASRITSVFDACQRLAAAPSDQALRDALRQAIVYGTVMASFAVQDFSLSALLKLTPDAIAGRYRDFEMLTRFQPV